MSGKRYVAVVGCQHYFGFRIFRPGMLVGLEKEPGNEYDQEAIRAVIDPIGKVGYVANSTHTVPMGRQSAGRIYDTFNDNIFGVVCFVTRDTVIVELAELAELAPDNTFKYELKVEVIKNGGSQVQRSQSRV